MSAVNSALAIRDDQAVFDEPQIRALREIVKLEHVPPAMQTVFLHQCRRTGLDPFLRQIYLVARWDGIEGRDRFTIQTGIDGFRLIRDRIERQRKLTVSYEDTVWRGKGSDAAWTDFWDSDSDEPPVAAKVVITVDDGARQRRFSAVAHYREYVAYKGRGQTEPNSMWKKMPAGQLAKCAEALVLRKAFPQDLGGLYTEEEMEQADQQAAAERQAATLRETAERLGKVAPSPAPDVPAATQADDGPPPPDEPVDAEIIPDDAEQQPTAGKPADEATRRAELQALAEIGDAGQRAVLSRLAAVAAEAGWTRADIDRAVTDRYGKAVGDLNMDQLSKLYSDARKAAGQLGGKL